VTPLWLLRLSALAYFAGMAVVDSWFFQATLHMSYLRWYRDNGAIISALASLVGVVWKDLNQNEALIAADPWVFLAANLQLLSGQLRVFGTCLVRAGDRLRSDRSASFFDSLAGLAGILVIAGALALWLIAIVPLQYFIVLFAGAPARMVLKLGADTSDETPSETRRWEANLIASPVSMTNGIVALSLIGLKWASG
jgi:hypothetical protein